MKPRVLPAGAKPAKATNAASGFPELSRPLMDQAVRARDPRFDGLFFVGITTTRVYCRPTCPSRTARSAHRRFFPSAAAAESADYRPCLRCRPELAPGRAPIDATTRLAHVAAARIASGGLNGRGVAALARDLGIGERHLRRVVERQVGASPLELAQTHRLLLAKQLLVDTRLSITRIAFASGFQSLRRFNALFRDRYRMCPSALRASRIAEMPVPPSPDSGESRVSLTLSYRPPLAWDGMLRLLARSPFPGAEHIEGRCYTRSVGLEGRVGMVVIEPGGENGAHAGTRFLRVQCSESLIPVLMPLLGGLRRMFDLEAESAIIDEHLARHGLATQVREVPGLRVPGTLDDFEAVLREVLLRFGTPGAAERLVASLGCTLPNAHRRVDRLLPTAAQVVEGGEFHLRAAGLSHRGASLLLCLARERNEGRLLLSPAGDGFAAIARLRAIPGVDQDLATAIVMRAMRWPDALPFFDPALQFSAGVARAEALHLISRRWHPWRAYAAQHLWLAACRAEPPKEREGTRERRPRASLAV